MGTDAIVVRGVGKTYAGRRSNTITSATFSVERSSVFGIVGSNGAGKTTLLKMLATLTIPSHGDIQVDGIDARREPQRVRRLLGVALADDRSFYYRLSGRQNLEFFGNLAGLRGRALAARIDIVVDQVDLAGSIDRHYATYSTGMRHRLVMARALLGDAPILILDEPTRAIDPAHAMEMRSLVRNELCRGAGKTIVIATNSLEEAWSTCDRIGVIRDGCIQGGQTPESLQEAIASASRIRIRLMSYDARLLGALAACDGVLECRGVAKDADAELEVTLAQGAGLNPILQTLVEAGVGVRSVESIAPSRGAAFSAMTRSERS
ncbi:MAG: ABC transporter ATP-binding protein [Vulcanimicrobiaceae bacterium]